MDQDYSIEAVEKKVEELKTDMIKIGFGILARMDNHEEVPDDLIEGQKIKEKQFNLLSKMLTIMKKSATEPKAKKGSMESILTEIGEVKLAMATIQQKLI